jgi:hypothetical protein
VFAGIALVGLALLPLAYTVATTTLAVVGLLLVLEGVGQGLVAIAYTDMVTATLPPRDRGVAGSLSQLTRTLGIVSGASVLTALHAWGAAGLSGQQAFMAGYRFSFLAAGGGLLAALLVSCAWPRVWLSR